jgi:hypothetical protein
MGQEGMTGQNCHGNVTPVSAPEAGLTEYHPSQSRGFVIEYRRTSTQSIDLSQPPPSHCRSIHRKRANHRYDYGCRRKMAWFILPRLPLYN